jgi:hypothetical protein
LNCLLQPNFYENSELRQKIDGFIPLKLIYNYEDDSFKAEVIEIE